jgi:hypothetical protein
MNAPRQSCGLTESRRPERRPSGWATSPAGVKPKLWGSDRKVSIKPYATRRSGGTRSSALGPCFVGEKSPLAREPLECVVTAIFEDKP